jgi:GxxExxY protein
MKNYLHSDITDKIIRAYYNVYNILGFGFLEKVYEKSLLIELRELGLYCESQQRINVYYKDKLVGDYYADIIVENKVIIEIKAADSLNPAHEAQLVNYLRGTDIEVGLLVNFGEKPEHRRRVLTKDYK